MKNRVALIISLLITIFLSQSYAANDTNYIEFIQPVVDNIGHAEKKNGLWLMKPANSKLQEQIKPFLNNDSIRISINLLD